MEVRLDEHSHRRNPYATGEVKQGTKDMQNQGGSVRNHYRVKYPRQLLAENEAVMTEQPPAVVGT
jgi:hypothetical protein